MLLQRIAAVGLCLTVLVVNTYAQDRKQDTITHNDILKKTDSTKSNKQTSFNISQLPEILQTAINNGVFSDNNGVLKVNTTIFGLEKLFNPNVAVDTNYIRQTFQRNFSFGGALDVSNTSTITGWQSNLQWAIFNNRDISRADTGYLKGKSKAATKLRDLKAQMKAKELLLVIDLYDKIAKPLLYADRVKTISDTAYTRLSNLLSKFKGSESYLVDTIAPALRLYSKEIAIDTTIYKEYHQQKTQLLDSLSGAFWSVISKRGVLTLSGNTDYKSNNWDSIIIKLQYMHGLGGVKDSTKPWDFYAGAFFNWKTDTVSKEALQRRVFTVKAGVNKVFAVRSDNTPFFEVLGTAEYDNIVLGMYKGEKKSTLTADFTFTINISKAVSVPLEIKYNPKQKNFLGLLNLTWNIKTSAAKS